MQKTKIIREIIGTRIEPYGFKYLKTDGPCRIFVREVTGIKRYFDPEIQTVKQYINIQESRFSKSLIARFHTDAFGHEKDTAFEQLKKYSKTGWLDYIDEPSYRKQLKLLADLIVEYGFECLREQSIEEDEIQTKAMQEKFVQEFEQLDKEFIDEYYIKRVPERVEDIDEWLRMIKQLIADNAQRPYVEVKDLLVKIAVFIANRYFELYKMYQHIYNNNNNSFPEPNMYIRITNMHRPDLLLQVAVRMWRSRYEDPDMTAVYINEIIKDMKYFLMMQKNPEKYYGKDYPLK